MANRTAWVSGNGQGLGSWAAATVAFAAADLTSLADSKALLSSAASPIGNDVNLDTYMDISAQITVASSTPRAGAYIGIWAAMLQQDGTTYGDGQLTAGTAATYLPPWAPLAVIPITAQAMTLMAGQATGLLLPPQKFKLICYNFTNVAFSATAANNVISFKTYNLNLNN